eukprot:GGOE01015233.1.p1 GENE.GGOE01015233.1~~GGOE01015233.1.p1  ORF type:complete len:496 (+),score=115.24 GGOE01015233.1:27-1514(+)
MGHRPATVSALMLFLACILLLLFGRAHPAIGHSDPWTMASTTATSVTTRGDTEFFVDAVLETSCRFMQQHQTAAIRRFAPWVQDIWLLAQFHSGGTTHLLFFPAGVFLAAPVFLDDFFTEQGKPVLRAALMTERAKKAVLAQMRHPKYKKRPVHGRIDYSASLRRWFGYGRLVPTAQQWWLPAYVHQEVLPLTAGLFASRGRNHSGEVEWAMDYLMHDPDSGHHMSLLRTAKCSFLPGGGNARWRADWMGHCLPVEGPFFDRYFRTVPHILLVELNTSNATHRASLADLLSRVLMPPPPRKDHVAPSLMVVAHADDEALFGGDSLILHGPWHLLCATCAERQGNGHAAQMYSYNRWREAEFRRLARMVGAAAYMCNYSSWGPSGDPFTRGLLRGFENDVSEHLARRGWRQIVTHYGEGPTQHVQHEEVWQTVQAAWNKHRRPCPLFGFAHSPTDDLALTMEHLRLLSAYPSQSSTIEKHWKVWYQRGGLRPWTPS